MTTQQIETLTIGAGQAGLATGYHLKQLGREFLILDGNKRVGDNWRCHWDSLRLFTPAKYDGLPGLPFPGDPWSFPGKDEVADYLEGYAVDMDLPVRLQTRVDRLEPGPGSGFTVRHGVEAITCDNVVVATGARGRTPHVPEFAGGLAPSIRQLHSTRYRRPSQLSDGPALVVGASHRGCEIAYEIAEHLPVTVCGRYAGNEPFAPGSGWDRMFSPLMVLVANHVLTRRTPPGRKVVRYLRGPHHGAAQHIDRYRSAVAMCMSVWATPEVPDRVRRWRRWCRLRSTVSAGSPTNPSAPTTVGRRRRGNYLLQVSDRFSCGRL